jgi:hypothetical protein
MRLKRNITIAFFKALKVTIIEECKTAPANLPGLSS